MNTLRETKQINHEKKQRRNREEDCVKPSASRGTGCVEETRLSIEQKKIQLNSTKVNDCMFKDKKITV